MVNSDDFKKEDGYTDWEAYHKAEEDAGERCYKCGAYNFFASGSKRLCGQCSKIEESDKFDHDSFVRCPKCKRTWNPGEEDDYEVYADGQHDICCGECGHDFEVSTNVSYSFESPELLEEDKDE